MAGLVRAKDHLPMVPEGLEHRTLFEEYVKMGAGRKIKDLVEKKITTRCWGTIQAWSIKYHWVKRARERDKEMMENIGLETHAESVEHKRLALDIVNKMIRDIAVIDEHGKVIDTTIKAKNVFDIRTLVDVRDEILGVKEKMAKTASQQTNIDKAIFIIKK